MQSDREPSSARDSDLAVPSLGAVHADRLTAVEEPLDPLELTLPAGPEAPAAARAALSDWLRGRVVEAMLTDARLLVSELVTNCLRHGHLAAGATIRISARFAHGILRLEVRDSGHAGAVTRRSPSISEGGGYGLHLVETLAARWGVNRAAGTHVWIELADTA